MTQATVRLKSHFKSRLETCPTTRPITRLTTRAKARESAHLTLSATADGAKEATQDVTENSTENPTVHGVARSTGVLEGIGLLYVVQCGYRMFGESWCERVGVDRPIVQTFSQIACRAYVGLA